MTIENEHTDSGDLPVQIFDFDGERVRVLMIDGDPWWVAADVAKTLGYRDAANALRLLRDRQRSYSDVSTSAGVRKAAVVNEGGLNRLIMRSSRPEAEAFQDWIEEKVIPMIRRTGSYSPKVPALPATYADALRALADEVEARARAEADAVEAKAEVAVLALPAAAWTTLASAEGDYSLRDAAHILNRDSGIKTGQNRLMRSLRDLKWVDKHGTPYASHSKWLRERPRSYTHPKTEVLVLAKPQVRVTIDGLDRLRRLLLG